MTKKEAQRLAVELRKRITRHSQICERIEVVKLCSHYRIEIRPATGKSSISHMVAISEVILYYDLSVYIDAENNVPCVNIF